MYKVWLLVEAQVQDLGSKPALDTPKLGLHNHGQEPYNRV